MFGTPERAPKDMSPRYKGEERERLESFEKRTLVLTLDGESLFSIDSFLRKILSRTRPVRSESGRKTSSVALPLWASARM
jgi:hypothetical protein